MNIFIKFEIGWISINDRKHKIYFKKTSTSYDVVKSCPIDSEVVETFVWEFFVFFTYFLKNIFKSLFLKIKWSQICDSRIKHKII